MRIDVQSLVNFGRHRATVTHHGAVTSLTQLDAKADVIASRLTAAGIGPQDRIAILIGNTPAFFAALLAVMKLQASAVLLKQEAKGAEVREMVIRTSAAAILSVAPWESRLGDLELDGYIERLDISGGTYGLGAWRTPVREPIAGPDELILQFTSGIAGRSKIVPRTVHNLLNELSNFEAHLHLGHSDATVCPTPLSHTYGLVNGCLLPLFSGRPVILPDSFLPNDIIDAVRTYHARVLIGVPVMYVAMAKAYGTSALDLESLRLCFSAGAPLAPEHLGLFKSRFGRFINQQYGSTETGAVAANLEPSATTADAVGDPIPGHEISLVMEDGLTAACGTAGEILVRSKATAACYLDDATLSQERFTPAGYLTGDVGLIDANGLLFVRGRRRSLINIGGLKVDPVEVENVLLMLDEVAECAVVAGPDPFAGEVVRAFVACRRPLSAKDVQAFCRGRLASHKVPRDIVFIDKLPRTPTGKVIARELIEA